MFSVLPAKLLPERYSLYGNSLEFKLNKMIEKNVGKFTQSFGNRGPPPFWEKFPNNPVFFLQQDNSDNFEYP